MTRSFLSNAVRYGVWTATAFVLRSALPGCGGTVNSGPLPVPNGTCNVPDFCSGTGGTLADAGRGAGVGGGTGLGGAGAGGAGGGAGGNGGLALTGSPCIVDSDCLDFCGTEGKGPVPGIEATCVQNTCKTKNAPASGSPTDLYVSSSSCTDAPMSGTAQSPFCTIDYARTQVQKLLANQMGDIRVNLAPGDYPISQTVVFRAADSGRNGFKVIYRSQDPAHPARIVGGKPVNGWTQAIAPGLPTGVWQTIIADGSSFNELFELVGGSFVRAIKARTPNVNAGYGTSTTSQGGYLYAGTGMQCTQFSQYRLDAPDNPCACGSAAICACGCSNNFFFYNSQDLNPAAWSPSTWPLQAVIFSGGYLNYAANIEPIDSVDIAQNKIQLSAGATTDYAIAPSSRYFVQGDPSMLDQAGEFALSSPANGTMTLYYYPRGGTQPMMNQVYRSTVAQLFKFAGSVDGLVQNIELDGLSFEISDSVIENPDRIAFDPDCGPTDACTAMIVMAYTNGLTVKNCHLKNAGLDGIYMSYQTPNANDVIYGNWIEQMGGSGVWARGGYTADGSNLTADNHDNFIKNNRVEWIGMHGYYGVGVKVEASSGNDVSHNLVQKAPGALIALADTQNGYLGYDDLRCGTEDAADIGLFYAWAKTIPNDANTANTAEQIRAWGASWSASSQLPVPSGCVDVAGNLNGPLCSYRPYGVYLDVGSNYWTLNNMCVSDYDPAAATANSQCLVAGGGYDQNTCGPEMLDNVSWDQFNPGLISPRIGLCPNFKYNRCPSCM